MSEQKENPNMGRPYSFTWKELGDLKQGRSTLGLDMPVVVYRLFQYTLRDVLSREFGARCAADLYRAAGHLAGTQLANNMLDLSGDFDFFCTNLQQTLSDLKIGILRLERGDLTRMDFVLTISEDLDCSGLPVTDETVCHYDEGLIAGIFEAYFRRKFQVEEVDCWASGGRTCRFSAKALPPCAIAPAAESGDPIIDDRK